MVNQGVQDAFMKFEDTKRILEDIETNNWTQRGVQQIPKWNKGHNKKSHIWIKDDNTKYKTGVKQKYGKPQKKESDFLNKQN
jgi:hypothetical protein